MDAFDGTLVASSSWPEYSWTPARRAAHEAKPISTSRHGVDPELSPGGCASYVAVAAALRAEDQRQDRE